MAPARAHSSSTGSLSIPSSASTTSSSPERASPPDIVVSSSPTFNRRRDFKAAARKRSQEKNRLKKSSSSSLMSGNMSVVSEVISEASDQKTDSSEELDIDLNEASFYSAKENITICEDNEAEFSMEESHTIVEISQKRSDCSSEGIEGVRRDPGPGPARQEDAAARAQALTSLSLDLAQPGASHGASQGASKGDSSGGFWSSVVSSPSQEHSGSPTESVRDILLQKRVSLSHTPDIVRVFQKETQAQEQHEFQKVKNELKPVDVEPSLVRRHSAAHCASLSSLTSSRSNMTGETSETSVESSSTMDQSLETCEVITTSSESEMSSYVTMTSSEQTNGELLRRSNSKDLILDLIPAPVESISVGVKQEDKVISKKAVKKERSQTALISDVLAKEKTEANKKSLKQGETPAGDKKSSVQGDSSLQSTNLIKTAASKKLEKKGSRTNGAVNTRNPSNSSINDSKQTKNDGKNLRSRSLSQEKQNKSKKVSSERKTSSRVRQKTPLKDEMLYNNLNGENKENGAPSRPGTSSNVKGGFLAPTKSWLLYMGNQVDLKSRSPSPGLNIKDRSPSPRRMRESSAESDTKVKSRKSSVGPGQRKVVEKDPNLPIVKRSNSVKKKSAINGDVKGKDLTKKEVSNGADGDERSANNVTKPTATNRHKSTTNCPLKKEVSASKLDPKLGAKTMSDSKTPINVKDGTESDSKNRQKKASPPPVAPKPKSNGCSSLKQETEEGIKVASSTASSSSAKLSKVSTSACSVSSTATLASSANSSFVTQGSSIMQMSSCSNSATTATATTTTASETTASQEVTEVSGIEETSLKASEVIQKFETASKSSSELNILNSAISAHLMQDTVSSRLKKISAEEFSAVERKASASKTESAAEAKKSWSDHSSKKSIASKKSTAVNTDSASGEKKVSTMTTVSSASATSESLLAASSSNLESSKTSHHSTTEQTVDSRRASQRNGIKNDFATETSPSSRDSNNQKTTMVVRLHPGQSRRLSAFMDYKDQTVNSKSWAGDIQCDDNPSSICGLEISFVSADIQDIDIKLIPVNQFCNINNPDLITDSVGQRSVQSSQ